MTIKTIPFDASKYLDDAESQAELLSEALATHDPRAVVHAVGVIARARGMSELSRATGIGRSSLYNAVQDDANPTIETLMKLLDGLQLDLKASARPAAIQHA